MGSRRHYSDDKAKASESKEGETLDAAKEEVKAETSEDSETMTKLKAKEQEVVDLTVRLLRISVRLSELTSLMQGRLRYLQADFLNLQRNAAREKEQQRDFAITRFAGDLLETVDVLAIALKSVPPDALEPASSTDAATPSSSTPPKSALAYLKELHEGVEMTHRLLAQTLFKYHVKPFDPTGDVFDPNRHEALYQAPVPGKTPGTVIDCQKTGYTIKDRILRAAQVGVAQEVPS